MKTESYRRQRLETQAPMYMLSPHQWCPEGMTRKLANILRGTVPVSRLEAGWIQQDPAMQVPRGHPEQQQYSPGTAHGQRTALSSAGSDKTAPVSTETNMDGQLPGGHPSQQQYPSPKQGKSTSKTPAGFCAGLPAAGAAGAATTVWFSAKDWRIDCWSLGWLVRKAKESACRGTGSLRTVPPVPCSRAVLSLMGLEGSACFVLALRSYWARMALIMSRVLSCEMGSWMYEVGFSTVVWMVVFGCVGRKSGPMKRTGCLTACAAIRGLPWTALSITEAQKAIAKTIGVRSDRRRSARPMIGAIVVND
jgi:hypothetical protein